MSGDLERAVPSNLAQIEGSERQRRFLTAIVSSTPDLIYAFDRSYRFIFANEALLQMWGKSLDDAIGKTLIKNGYEPWHAADRARHPRGTGRRGRSQVRACRLMLPHPSALRKEGRDL